jgi:uncharacterized protein (TIGR02118 family)
MRPQREGTCCSGLKRPADVFTIWIGSRKGQTMIKVSVLYPHKDGSRFDMNYYLDRHIPMVREVLGNACKGVSVEQGIAGGAPGTPPTYTATGHLVFDSVETFQGAFGPHAAKIMADIPNYTDIQPVIQISEIKLR